MNQEGILVGCDQNQEWLLSWWWKHYSAHNSFPVLFVDFGMSEKGKAWCRERGTCAPLQGFENFREKAISPENRRLWETQISSFSTFRNVFFKKPFALLQSPFPLSIWLDLDCQVRAPLDPLFCFLHFGIEFSVRRQNTSYSAGVIAFRRDAPILHSWVQEILQRNDQYIHDEAALSKLLPQASFTELPDIYNWNPLHGVNHQAVVLHFQGGFLKEELRKVIAKDSDF